MVKKIISRLREPEAELRLQEAFKTKPEMSVAEVKNYTSGAKQGLLNALSTVLPQFPLASIYFHLEYFNPSMFCVLAVICNHKHIFSISRSSWQSLIASVSSDVW